MKPTILLVEDEESDRIFLKLAFEKAGITNPIQVATDGQQALDYFKGLGRFADREEFPIPYLVIMDAKLPRVNGLDLLKMIRAEVNLNAVIVLILTASDQAKDIAKAYQLGVNGYLVKPHTLEGLNRMIQALKDFWLVQNRPALEFSFPESAAATTVRPY